MTWIFRDLPNCKFIPLVLFASVLFSSCINTQITSSVIGTYTGEAERVFIKTQVTPTHHYYLRTVSSELEAAFKERGIAVKVYLYEPLSEKDDPQLIEERIRSFQTDLVFEIVQISQSSNPGYAAPIYDGTNWIAGGGNGSSSSTLRLRIINRRNSRPVWQASTETRINNGIVSIEDGTGAEKTAEKIIEALVKDGILKPLEPETK